ncbi:polygalacturonase [Quercus suber]|uniref:Polygalacturonase n=1 Tax=Quercus suber TaxID=58331 RepID=A0AAW0K4V8_QUESU
MFSNIQVSEVETPIMIDQYYCDKSKCQNETSAVAVSSIDYVNIQGTYKVTPVHFACSDNVPCTIEAYSELRTTTVPLNDRLQTGQSPSAKAQSTVDSC